MKWYCYWSQADQKYKLSDANGIPATADNSNHEIARFASFDMAYDYVTKLNGNVIGNAYSRWTIQSR